MKKRMKLFVWTRFCPDYTSGLAFAIAKDETQARAMIQKQIGYEPEWGELHIHSTTLKQAYAVTGGG